jgi:hypothetical protein
MSRKIIKIPVLPNKKVDKQKLHQDVQEQLALQYHLEENRCTDKNVLKPFYGCTDKSLEEQFLKDEKVFAEHGKQLEMLEKEIPLDKNQEDIYQFMMNNFVYKPSYEIVESLGLEEIEETYYEDKKDSAVLECNIKYLIAKYNREILKGKTQSELDFLQQLKQMVSTNKVSFLDIHEFDLSPSRGLQSFIYSSGGNLILK